MPTLKSLQPSNYTLRKLSESVETDHCVKAVNVLTSSDLKACLVCVYFKNLERKVKCLSDRETD